MASQLLPLPGNEARSLALVLSICVTWVLTIWSLCAYDFVLTRFIACGLPTTPTVVSESPRCGQSGTTSMASQLLPLPGNEARSLALVLSTCVSWVLTIWSLCAYDFVLTRFIACGLLVTPTVVSESP